MPLKLMLFISFFSLDAFSCEKFLDVSYLDWATNIKHSLGLIEKSKDLKYLKNRTYSFTGFGDFKVRNFFDKGKEGEVYLIQNKFGEKFILKYFISQTAMSENLKMLEKLSGLKVNTPQIVAKYQSNVIFSYEEGVTVFDIEKFYTRLGLTENQKLEVLWKYRRWKSEVDGKIKSFKKDVKIYNFNVIYHFETDKFTLIDPR